MVAARYGVPVAAIKGFRNYKVSARERGGEDRVLPELEGVDFAGREVVYVPDVDVKPRSREEVMGAVPAACEWLISRRGGVPKIALLPEGAKDLDQWLLSLPEERRAAEAQGLLSGAVSLSRWTGSPGDDRNPQLGPGSSRQPGTRAHSGMRAANDARRTGGPDGRSRLLAEDEYDPPAAAGSTDGDPHGTSRTKSRVAEDAPTRDPEEEQGPRGPGGVADPQADPNGPGSDRHGETSSGSAPAARDAERARKGPMHPAMARWYEVAGYSDEQVAEARRETAMRKITGKRRPPVRDTPVTLPRWTAGEAILALSVALVVAVVLGVLAHAMAALGGAVGAAGALLTRPVWWLEAALYGWAGALAADWMVGRRHRARRRQLHAHLGGEK